jgi:hypothetical protein
MYRPRVQVAAGLALEGGAPGCGIRAILGRAPRLYLMAGKQGRANEGSQVQQTVNVEFFQKVENVYNFRCVYNVQCILSIVHCLGVARLGYRVLVGN